LECPDIIGFLPEKDYYQRYSITNATAVQ